MTDDAAPRFDSIEDAVEEIKRGKMVILVDDADRENEGDLVLAAEHVTPEAINFMARHARGLICLSITEEQVKRLGLPMMVQDNQSTYSTAFTVSIEAARGVSTGISAADRACCSISKSRATARSDITRSHDVAAKRGPVSRQPRADEE